MASWPDDIMVAAQSLYDSEKSLGAPPNLKTEAAMKQFMQADSAAASPPNAFKDPVAFTKDMFGKMTDTAKSAADAPQQYVADKAGAIAGYVGAIGLGLAFVVIALMSSDQVKSAAAAVASKVPA